jgi:acetyltransferase-like isoleucine patch superfamily enzyme
MNFLRDMPYAWRRWRLQSATVRIGNGTRVCPQVSARPGAGRIKVGENCRLETGLLLEAWAGTIEIGEHVFLGPYAVIYGHGNVAIGSGTLVSMHCRILSSNHTIAEFGKEIRLQPDILKPTIIGRDVWLGAGVTVLGGVTVGDGCIVGAGAVVTKSLPPGAIAYGVPATRQGWRTGAPSSS